MRVEHAALTDVGCKRSRNEDAFFVSDALKLYVVSDGMGGHRAGDVASRLVVEGMQEHIHRATYRESGLGSPSPSGLSPAASCLVDAIGHANRKVWDAARSEAACDGMGATVSAVWICGGTFVSANVGDSPVYCVHGQTIEMVSVPHTLSAGSPGDEGAGHTHVLTRAVGVNEQVVADVCESQCYPGDRFVLCSDGLSNRVSEEEILDAVRRFSAGDASRFLVDLAKDRGGDDNITVVVVTVGARRGVARWLRRVFGPLLPGMKTRARRGGA
ncbi:protein phosphatase [Desulfoluna spongiiphila]|uniref:Protein phosphatase n=2 Tax=Desulfoluna spongiiphila TaxID=419481 RepID=A0A1G5JG76_9BACT|nr:protein phosphatase [Desulfoluna spongiiphila]VVS93117.1 protein phosphatase 2c [Desulfoluna spongiiphila]